MTYLPGGTRAAIEAHTVLAASNGQVVAVTVVLLDESGRVAALLRERGFA